MTEITYTSPIAMVKIDGAKVRQFREQKGLTQLYLATAVQVTTDTISRWENKRYPAIKKENALKLAEALEVTLDTICLPETAESESASPAVNPVVAENALQPTDNEPATVSGATTGRKIWPIVLLSTTLLTILLAFMLSWQASQTENSAEISAERILPARCTPGQPFPVVLHLKTSANGNQAVIVKEQPPAQAKIRKSNPAPALTSNKEHLLKWLQKIDGQQRFLYTLSLSAETGETATFQGTVSSAGNEQQPNLITGPNTIAVGQHHWADSDADNTISDAEILAVYEQYGDIETLGLDLDLIEEMWLGSGYSWDAKKGSYTIRP